MKKLEKISKMKGFVFDMDGTLVNYNNEPFHSTWDALIPLLDKDGRKEWVDIRNFYLKKGKEKYSEWFNKQISLLNRILVEEAKKVLFPIPYTKGAVEFLNILKNKKDNAEIYAGLITSGLDIVAKKIKKDFSLDYVVCSELYVEEGKFNGKGRYNVNLWEKEKEIEKFSKKFNLKLDEICYFGDSVGDTEIFKLVGLGIAINPKQKDVSEDADYSFNDFKEFQKFLENLGDNNFLTT